MTLVSKYEEDEKRAQSLIEKATDPHQYDSLELDWEREGMLDSPTRQFFHEYLAQNLEDLTNKSVVDIGSGTGHFAKLFTKLGAKEIYGIEPARKNVEISKKFNPEMIVEEAGLENAVGSKKFNVAVVVMAFEHMKNLEMAFHKIASLMKSNGTLYAVTGDLGYHITERHGHEFWVERLQNEEVVVATRRSYGLMHDIFRPVGMFVDAAKKAGFSLKKHVPLTPTENFIQTEPKYKQFEQTPICHLLIFEYDKKPARPG